MKYYRADQCANLGNLGKFSFLGEIDSSPRLRIYCKIYTFMNLLYLNVFNLKKPVLESVSLIIIINHCLKAV